MQKAVNDVIDIFTSEDMEDTPLVIFYYYMAQVTSGNIAHCDWLLAWRDYYVMTAGIMKMVNALWTKQTQNLKKKIFNKFLCLKNKQNTEMSDEEHSNSEFYYPKEQEMAEER